MRKCSTYCIREACPKWILCELRATGESQRKRHVTVPKTVFDDDIYCQNRKASERMRKLLYGGDRIVIEITCTLVDGPRSSSTRTICELFIKDTRNTCSSSICTTRAYEPGIYALSDVRTPSDSLFIYTKGELRLVFPECLSD